VRPKCLGEYFYTKLRRQQKDGNNVIKRDSVIYTLSTIILAQSVKGGRSLLDMMDEKFVQN
jgi:hypothetical protein